MFNGKKWATIKLNKEEFKKKSVAEGYFSGIKS